jgi:hypothetical protein
MRKIALAFLILATSACGSSDRAQRPENSPADAVQTAAYGVAASQRPQTRTGRVEQAGRTNAVLRAGSALCGDSSIRGVEIGRVASQVNGCGIEKAVGVQSVAGVTLSPRATVDCPTARALKAWVDGAVKPAFADTGGGVSSLRVAAHYACRTRNNRPGGQISEHGRGRAIDISEFRMRDGSRVSVLTGWGDPKTRNDMRQVHRAACGPFGTVLGPQADRYHLDHFHFDTAEHRGGPYCR